MPEFLRLPIAEQRDILNSMSAQMELSPQVLHKDVWVCWVLRELFASDTGVHMAFKGGTSLSKVFQAIHRFSEDVDVTLDYRDLSPDPKIDIFSLRTSKNAKKRFSEKLKVQVRNHVHGVLYPALSNSFSEVTDGVGRTELSDDGEKLWFHYPSVPDAGIGYMGDWILVEFGGRNAIEPNGPHHIAPLIAEWLPELEFPEGRVMVLSPERTFWEKATLIHVECNRQRLNDPNRVSRHLYDLVMLSRGEIGKRALKDRLLLANVIRHKSVFFDASYAHYDECLAGRFRLVPEEPLLSDMRRDYASMQSAGMFYAEVPSFDDLMEELRVLEFSINS
ncbi:MAG TPA: nucleotidyl transferase AbiEii/AbiGii toxin family protein [Candidatus Hydrogenedentes bacterium]|nr:nucleotidyl transferase AbiEii/AbiGii toxin family protein [Candidatus Hydrogenedentota bacterium]